MNNKKILAKILALFFSWRVLLFLAAFLATLIITKFGGRFPYVDRVLTVTGLPSWVWGFGNFDGVHYLRLAQNGYSAQYSQAFFPLYPLLIRVFNFLPKGNLDTNFFVDPSYFYTGLILSNIFFAVSLYLLYKLWYEEYKNKVPNLAVVLLLTFPTAFYFGSIYSESLFLLLAVLTFWFVRKDKFVLAGIAASLASATKVQGVLLGLFLAIELYFKYKDKFKNNIGRFWKDLLGVAVSPLGLLAYMFYLGKNFGNPIYFLTAQPAFGAERSGIPLVSLPQVIYRYIKMLLTVNPTGVSFWNAALELAVTIFLIWLLVYSFKKIRFSYWIFALLAAILPTLTGTLSSMPRYALLAFPLIPAVTRFEKAGKYIIITQVLLELVLTAIFIRGYWVS